MIKNCTFLSIYKQLVYGIDTSLKYAYKAKFFGYIGTREINAINGLRIAGLALRHYVARLLAERYAVEAAVLTGP